MKWKLDKRKIKIVTLCITFVFFFFYYGSNKINLVYVTIPVTRINVNSKREGKNRV